MVITYNGDNYFKIQAGDNVVLIDPLNQRSMKGATLVLWTENPSEKGETERPFTVRHQGEYEIQDIHVLGWTENGTTVYRLTMDSMTIVILGHLRKEPSPETREYLQDADILITPAGRKPYLTAAEAAKLVRQLEPGIVIPALYDNLKPFLKEMGQEKCETEEKLTLKKKDLKAQAMIIKCLSF